MGAGMIPYGHHTIEDDDVQAVTEALRSGQIVQGPVVKGFESDLAGYCKIDHVVAVSSGTAALHAALVAYGIRDGQNVIVPAITFAATAGAVLAVKANPIFVDVDQEKLHIDPARIAQILRRGSAKVSAVIAVDYGGQPCDYEALRQVLDHAPGGRKVVLIADAAHSFGARIAGRPACRAADLACFSFHPVKTITTGEGGAIVTDFPEIARRARAFRDHGRDQGVAYTAGLNYRMSELHAALGRSQLRKAGRFLVRRWEIAEKYSYCFRDVPGVSTPPSHYNNDSAWHLFVVRVEAKKRNAFRAALADRGVGTQVHYRPVYDHPVYSQWRTDCPVADREAARVVSLPIYPGMTDKEVEHVIDSVRAVAKVVLT